MRVDGSPATRLDGRPHERPAADRHQRLRPDGPARAARRLGLATTSSSCTSTSSSGGAATGAHLLEFDSVHGRWPHDVAATATDRRRSTASAIGWSSAAEPGRRRLGRARRRHRARVLGQVPHRARRSRRTSTRACRRSSSRRRSRTAARSTSSSASTTTSTTPPRTTIVTAASCTTNCLAPVVKVMHEGIGIRHGSITTLHDLTNTQTIVDAPHKDLRRARAAALSLIPTTTGSATAIGLIFPELEGKLDGHAVRVPLLNASLTDCVFEVARPTTVEEVNGLLRDGGRTARCAGSSATRSAARLRRLQGRPALGDRRRALDDGRRRHAGEGLRLVRQRVGLRQPPGRARRASSAGSRARPYAARRQAAAGRHATARPATSATTRSSPAPTGRTRSPTARSACSCSSTSTSSATRPFAARVAVPVLRALRHRHEPRRRLPRRPLRAQDDARRRALHADSSRSRCSRSRPSPWLVVPYVMAAQALSGHRQGPHEDELEERGQARRARRRARTRCSAGSRS